MKLSDSVLTPWSALRRRTVLRLGAGLGALALAAVTGLTATTPAAAQSAFPSRPVTLVVPFPAGGSTDLVARLGGDEFAILLPETTYDSSEIAIRKLRRRLDGLMSENGWEVTFSIGVVTFDHPPHALDDVIREADAAMYTVKHGTKNDIHHVEAGKAPKDVG